ncbi:MAG TPA: O-antigen ligase family protein [Caulobacteraceae bacterium]|jgi:O-antigen ligase
MIELLRGRRAPACLAHATPWRAGVYAAAFGLVPLLAWLWPLGFAVLVPVMSVLLLPLWARPQQAWPVAALLFALALWGAGALGWSPALARVSPDDPETQFALKLLIQVAAFGFFAAGAAGLSGTAAHRAMTVLALGLLALGVVLVVEGATTAALYQQLLAAMGEPIRPDLAERNVGKGQFVLALLAWPALVFLAAERRRLLPMLVGLLLLCPFLLNELAPLAGLMAGGIAFLLVRWLGPLGARLVGGLLAAQVLVSPLLVHAAADAGVLGALARAAPESWRQRLEVWGFAADRITESPFLGWGLEASRMFPSVPLHPHNAGLQVWLELGAVGALLFALLWLRVYEAAARIARDDRTGAAACAGAAGAYFTIGALSYGVWQEWWLASAALVAAACTALIVARRRARLADGPAELRHDELTPL